MQEKSSFVVSYDWLQQNLNDPKLSIIDGSWYLPASNRNGKSEYLAGHIKNAVFFDHDEIHDSRSNLPHTLPQPEVFFYHMSQMGISSDDTIIVYDGMGFFSAPRVWWMLRLFGAKKVFILDGGFDRWKAEGRPVTSEVTMVEPTQFYGDFKRQNVVFLDEMREIVSLKSAQIADARGKGRFSGDESEPRPNMRSGHMPSARNVPAMSLSENGQFKTLSELKKIFEESGINIEAPVVTSCGSGITAAVVSLALESLGNTDHRLYDGSWSEWGALSDTQIVCGEEP